MPEADIRRRFLRSLETLPRAVMLIDRVAIHDNADDRPYRLIAQSDFVSSAIAEPAPAWARPAVGAIRLRCEGG